MKNNGTRSNAEHGAYLADGMQVCSTLQCVHCNCHRPKALMVGFCRNCMGPTCKSQACMRCNPWERQVDRLEKKIQTDRIYDNICAK